MSRTFSRNKGSFDNLNVWLRWGAKAKARQIRFTLLRLSPLALAIDRVLQCVASRGIVSNVIVNTRSTSRSLNRRPVPGRGSSSHPSSRLATKRRRHLPTVCGATFSSPLIRWLLLPVAHSSTIRDRCAKAWLDLGRLAHCCKRSRSSTVSFNSVFGRPVRIVSLLYTLYERIPTSVTYFRDGTLGTFAKCCCGAGFDLPPRLGTRFRLTTGYTFDSVNGRNL